MTAREISTIVRYGPRPIIELITNRGHTIEAEIHDSLYNRIKNWDHSGLLEAFHVSEGKGFGLRDATVGAETWSKPWNGPWLAHRPTLPDRRPH